MAKTSSTGNTSQFDTSHSASSASTTPDVPDWLKQPAQQLAGNVGGLIDQGPGQFTPQTNGLQQQGLNATANLQNPQFTGAYKSLDQVGAVGDVGGQSVLSGLDQYYNPFKDQITNPVLADYDAQAGQTRAAQAAAAARNNAFAGSRYGFQEAETEGQLARGRAATEGGLLKDMYGQAVGMSEADTGRRQQADLANQQTGIANNQTFIAKAQEQAALRNSIQENARANAAAQLGAGQQQFANDTAIKQYPLEYQQALEGLFKGLDPSMFVGQSVNTTDDQSGSSVGNSATTGKTSSGGLLSKLGKVAQIGGTVMAMSDARVKLDVQTIRHDRKGRRWVSYAYAWEPWKRRVGVIAQEVLKTDPQAVAVAPSGLMMVDYGRLV